MESTLHNGNDRAGSVASFARAFLSQDHMDGEWQLLADVTAEDRETGKPERKRKIARLLLDARTELTDEELKVRLAPFTLGVADSQ